MAKYTYHLECDYNGTFTKFEEASKDYCLGYLDCMKYQHPRLATRVVRSDSKIIDQILADDNVAIGMVAGWPTAEQYERAATVALEKAQKIRENSLTNAKRRNTINE